MKKLIVWIVFLMLVIPIISAVQTKVTVKTEPNMIVCVLASDSNTDDKLARECPRADSTGEAIITISTADIYIDIEIRVTDNNNVIIGQELFDMHKPGESITLDFRKNTEEQNETESANVTEVAEEANETGAVEGETGAEEEAGKGILGSAIFGKVGKLSKIYYIVGVVILAGIIGFFGTRAFLRRSAKEDKPIKVKSLSKMQEENYRDKELEEAERKIREAQQELQKIKNAEKIKKAERELEEKQRELAKLKRGED